MRLLEKAAFNGHTLSPKGSYIVLLSVRSTGKVVSSTIFMTSKEARTEFNRIQSAS